jgi:hypothetical protein
MLQVCRGIIHNEQMLKGDSSRLQVSMAETNLAHAAIHMISSSDPDVMHEALALCVKLVDGGNRVVQDELLKQFRLTKSELFFEELSWRMKQGIEKLTEVGTIYRDVEIFSSSLMMIRQERLISK